MNDIILFLLSLSLSACANLIPGQSKNFVDFKKQKINNKVQLLKIWGKPSEKINFNLANKKYLYLRYTDKNQKPLADFTINPKDNSVVERLYYPKERDSQISFNIFTRNNFKNVKFNKTLDSCSHHDQFIHYNKEEGIIIFSHQVLNLDRSVDLIGYSSLEMIENRLSANKNKKCGFKTE